MTAAPMPWPMAMMAFTISRFTSETWTSRTSEMSIFR